MTNWKVPTIVVRLMSVSNFSCTYRAKPWKF